MIVKKEAIVAITPAADHSAYEGYFVSLTAGKTVVLSSATAVIPFGIILDGETTAGQDSIGVCGGSFGSALVKLSGTVAVGDSLQLHTDGSCVVDAASGARIVVAKALQAGDAGELIEAVILTPVQYT